MVGHFALTRRQRPRIATQIYVVQVSFRTSNLSFFESVDCVMSNWREWGICSQSCGGGLKGRRKDVLVEPKCNGTACPLELTQTAYCIEEDCSQGKIINLSSFLLTFSFTLYRGWATARSTVGNKWEWKIHSGERFIRWNWLQQLHLCQLLARQQRKDDRQEKGRGICLEDWELQRQGCRCQVEKHGQQEKRRMGDANIQDRRISSGTRDTWS